MTMHALQELIERLRRLPGLGPRSARRIALHMLKRRDDTLIPLIQTLESVCNTVQTCPRCFNVDVISPCHMCTDPTRMATTLCVVSDVNDVWAMERTHAFRGHYHVLGGLLSAVDGVGPQHIHIAELLDRLAHGSYEEVVFAFNATIDAQTTMHYIMNQLNHLSLRFTSLAKGVPLGGELDYLDDATLSLALQGRQAV